MAVLGTWVDRSLQSQAGGAWGGVTNLTVPQSLPTQPDYAFANPISQQGLTAPLGFGVLRGASNINTLQVVNGTIAGASASAFLVEIVSVYIWAPAR
jgi:hypothetical protein